MDPVQVDPADAAYLSFDSPTTDANVGLYMPLDGTVTLDAVRRQVAGGLRRMPELRRRLHPVAHGLDRPWWVDDVDIDLTSQVTEHPVPAPGDTAAIEATVAELCPVHLDRERPLWRIHLLQIPSRGSRPAASALLSVVHHAIADGARHIDILDALFGPETRPAPLRDRRWSPTLPPDDIHLLTRSAAASQAWLADQLVRATRTATDALHTWPSLTIPNYHAAPATRFNKAVSAQRSWSMVRLDIADSKPVREAGQITVGAVLNAAIAGALRSWLEQHDELPKDPLVALLPIGQRDQSDDPAGGANRIGIASCAIPTHLPDRRERLATAQTLLAKAKNAPLMDAATMAMANRFSTPVTGSLASTLSSALRLQDMIPSTYNLLVSSVAMPAGELRVAGRIVVGQYPMGPVFDGMGVNVTAHGYRGMLDVGVATCSDMAQDAGAIAGLIGTEYRAICRLGQA